MKASQAQIVATWSWPALSHFRQPKGKEELTSVLNGLTLVTEVPVLEPLVGILV